jgi:hypothetical protein
MIADVDGLPLVGRSARSLGIRTINEATDPDVFVIAADDVLQPGTGGMSVSPDDPNHLPPFRRPPALGGRGKDPVWVIDTADLGMELQFRQDSSTHGLIEPAHPTMLKEFEEALARTRARWQRVIG